MIRLRRKRFGYPSVSGNSAGRFLPFAVEQFVKIRGKQSIGAYNREKQNALHLKKELSGVRSFRVLCLVLKPTTNKIAALRQCVNHVTINNSYVMVVREIKANFTGRKELQI